MQVFRGQILRNFRIFYFFNCFCFKFMPLIFMFSGNVLLANLMVAALLVTACALPAEATRLLAGWSEPSSVCTPTWIMIMLASYGSLITFPFLAWENHNRHRTFKPMPSCLLILLVIVSWVMSFSLTVAQWYYGYGPNHCQNTHDTPFKEDSYSMCLILSFVVTLIVVTALLHIHTLLMKTHTEGRDRRMDKSAPSSPRLIKASELQRDVTLVATNLTVSLVTGVLWASGLALDWYGTVPENYKWFSSAAAASYGILYGFHRPFRDSYYQLFNYCCFKTTVRVSRRGRNDNSLESYYAAQVQRTQQTNHTLSYILPPFKWYSQAPRTQHTVEL